jgi:hypothetical protein
VESAPTERSADRWSIQLGAFAQRAAAEKAAHGPLAKLAVLKGRALLVIAPDKTDKERFYRVRLINLSKHEADKACTELHRKRQKCTLVAPGALRLASSSG